MKKDSFRDVRDCYHFDTLRYPEDSTAVVLSLWVATQNWVAGNIPLGREYFIKITLFFILDEPLLINAKACGKENNIEISLHMISDVLFLQLVRGSRNCPQKYKRNLPIR
jgi:hypothetical protein